MEFEPLKLFNICILDSTKKSLACRPCPTRFGYTYTRLVASRVRTSEERISKEQNSICNDI